VAWVPPRHSVRPGKNGLSAPSQSARGGDKEALAREIGGLTITLIQLPVNQPLLCKPWAVRAVISGPLHPIPGAISALVDGTGARTGKLVIVGATNGPPHDYFRCN